MKQSREGKNFRGGVRLARCDIAVCEALCCYDGAYVDRADEARIKAALVHFPEFFRGLSKQPFIEENWRGQGAGRKTATRAWNYDRVIPAHFSATRCVFADDRGWCRLESAARANGLHPWIFKPATCFLFPLMDDKPGARPAPPGGDPFDLGEEYPGFATFVDCGKHRPEGRPWREVLSDELAALETPIDRYFAAWQARNRRSSRMH